MSRQPRKVFGFTGAAKYGPVADKEEDKKKNGSRGDNSDGVNDALLTAQVIGTTSPDCSDNCTIS